MIASVTLVLTGLSYIYVTVAVKNAVDWYYSNKSLNISHFFWDILCLKSTPEIQILTHSGNPNLDARQSDLSPLRRLSPATSLTILPDKGDSNPRGMRFRQQLPLTMPIKSAVDCYIASNLCIFITYGTVVYYEVTLIITCYKQGVAIKTWPLWYFSGFDTYCHPIGSLCICVLLWVIISRSRF